MTTKMMFAMVLAGCIAPGGDGGGGGTATVTWDFNQIDGSPAGCADGYPTMVIETYGFDDAGISNADVSDHLFDCAAGTATVDFDSPGGAIEWIETDSTGGTKLMQDVTSEIAEGGPTRVDFTTGMTTATTTFYVDGGWAWMEWGFVGMQSGADLDSCEGAGVDRVEITFTNSDTGVATTASAGCTDLPPFFELTSSRGLGSLIQPLAPGQYTWTAKAYAGDQVVGTGADGVGFYLQSMNDIDFVADPISLELTTR